LEIDSNDYAAYIAQTEHTAIEVHLDYFGRKSIRQLQIFLPEDTVECDILTGDIYWRVSGEHVHLDNERDGYQMRELQHFFEILDGKCSNDSNIADALRVLRYARGDFEKLIFCLLSYTALMSSSATILINFSLLFLLLQAIQHLVGSI